MPKTPRMTVPHKAVLVNGDTIEYEGAHPTAWTVGGVDAKGNADGSPVQTFAVQAIIPGSWPEDDIFAADPRDAEIERLRKIVAQLRGNRDPQDDQLAQLRSQVEALMSEKTPDVQLTPDEIRANQDAEEEYRAGKAE